MAVILLFEGYEWMKFDIVILQKQIECNKTASNMHGSIYYNHKSNKESPIKCKFFYLLGNKRNIKKEIFKIDVTDKI